MDEEEEDFCFVQVLIKDYYNHYSWRLIGEVLLVLSIRSRTKTIRAIPLFIVSTWKPKILQSILSPLSI
jgi:hypothetical protein